MPKVKINLETCGRTASCYFRHPDLFREQDDGYPEVLIDSFEPAQRDAVLDAIDGCATGSISIEEDDESS